MNNKPMFIDLVEKHQKDVGRVIDEKKGNKPIRKV